ncbi:MAG TPA: endonuclease/exonuclease/phosphatase family protein [Polyangiaceae bacterium]|nr:endonuclease/exonuclease/phosphatase family protein [Polyangiaceae bacterium]
MKFRVASWNVENLFPPNGAAPESARSYRAKLANLASVIRELRPDVIALQEVGSADALTDLQSALGDSMPHAALSENPDRRGIRVALLSKRVLNEATEIVAFSANVPFKIEDHRGKPVTTLRRGALSASITIDRTRVHLLTAHLKSKLLDYPTPDGGTAFSTKDESLRARIASLALAERTAEAVTLRTAVSEILSKHPSDAVILLGDLNDVPEAATTQILQGPQGSQPGTGGFHRPDQGDPARLFNLASFIPADRRYSRINNGVRELIDHIFVSEHLLPVRPDGKRAAPRVDSHPAAQGGEIESVGDDPRKREGRAASDHAPVVAEFEI